MAVLWMLQKHNQRTKMNKLILSQYENIIIHYVENNNITSKLIT